MRKNKIKKLFLTLVLLSLLVACSNPVQNNSKDDTSSEKDDSDTVLVEDNPIEMIFSLLGKEYKLPTSYKDLKEDGWILEDDPTFILEPQQFIKNRYVRNGSHILELSFYNPKDEAQTLENSLISAVASENRTFGSDVASDIVVHRLIDFETDIDEIVDQLGEYEKESSAQFDTYTFQHDLLSKTEIKIELDSNTTRWITIENFNLD